ncbi:hypothetical protein [Aeromicrobium sp. HA]|uniref:hypothetical protein n=1 Tax=Aeromicrobium sp. HA TaxID=3009077 RepID=UPI0022AF75CB|nr:hypothetical protein [Aeromicrobium sp. HA]
MSEYTPDDEDMRACYVHHCQITHGLTETAAWAEFHRWLTQHDAEVKAQALREFASDLEATIDDVVRLDASRGNDVALTYINCTQMDTAMAREHADSIHPTTKES